MPRTSEKSPPCCMRAGKSRSRTAGVWCRRRLEAWNAPAGHARSQASLPSPGRTPHARWRRRRARGQGRPFGAVEPESQHADADAASSSWLVVVTVAPVRPASVRAHLSFLPPAANVSLHEWLETTIRASHRFFLLRRGDGQMEMSIKVLHDDDRHIQSCCVVSC